MLLGVKTAPSCFQRIMQILLEASPCELVYQEDIVIAVNISSKFEDRRDQVERILDKNVRVDKYKTLRDINIFDLLGYEISAEENKYSTENGEDSSILRVDLCQGIKTTDRSN